MVICKSSLLPYTWEILNVTLLQSYVVTKSFWFCICFVRRLIVSVASCSSSLRKRLMSSPSVVFLCRDSA